MRTPTTIQSTRGAGRRRTVTGAALAAATALALSACGSESTSTPDSGSGSKTVTLVTHDSFNVAKKTLAAFEKSSGLKVRVLRSGDAGETVNKAVLTKGKPQGDVLFGVDNTLLSKAVDAKLFTPYRAAGLDEVPSAMHVDGDAVTPVDYGDVCVNYDRAWFAKKDLPVPKTLDDLTEPAYRDQLVVENAATSSPGLAFLLATVAHYGEDGYEAYWKKLAANGVDVVDGWEEAYNTRFSGSAASKGKGDRPLVVSYASSPPVEVTDPAETPADESPTGVITDTCFRQTEYAGLLDGAANPTGGRKLLDFLLSTEFQSGVPEQMYVWPSREDVDPPATWTKYSAIPNDPKTVPPQSIEANREDWVRTWQDTVLR